MFIALFKAYNGIGLTILGLVLAVHDYRETNWKFFWFSLAILVGGTMFGYDGVWQLLNGCSP